MWSSSNAIFNINGQGLDGLKKTLELAFGDKTVFGFRYQKEKGLILYNYGSSDKLTKFPVPITAAQAAEIAFQWLETGEAKHVPMKGWDANADHDGDNEPGWRVYTEDWGHVDGDWNCIAVKPAYMWYGK